MKKIFKIVPFILLVFLVGCDGNNDFGFSDSPTTGWVEFLSASTTTEQVADNVTIPLFINVPIFENGLTINYVIEAVEGDFTQFVSSNSGSIFADPALNSRNFDVNIGLSGLETGRDFMTVFDIVLSSVSNGVNIGVDESSIVRHRITIPCSNPIILPDNYFVGDYEIVDVTGTIGPGNGTENFESGTVTLSIDPNNPNIRMFNSAILPGFTPNPHAITLTFTGDNVIVLGDIFSGIGCGGGGGAEYIYTEATNNTPWDVCNDQQVIINYTEDPFGSCGGPFTSSVMFTKVNN